MLEKKIKTDLTINTECLSCYSFAVFIPLSARDRTPMGGFARKPGFFVLVVNTPRQKTRTIAEETPQKLHTADYKFSSRKFGRRLPAAVRAKRLVITDQRTDVFCVRNYNSWGTGYGAAYLQCIQPGLAGTEVECPCHLYDLTSVVEPRQAATSPLREIHTRIRTAGGSCRYCRISFSS